jgi:hypothetical protein
MKKNNSEVINGILMFFALALYFFIEQLFDNQDKSYLRFFNALIVLYFVNRTVKQKIESGNDHFLRNFFSAVATSIIGVALSIVSFFFYITAWTGVGYLSELSMPFLSGGSQLQVHQFCLALFIEGIASAIIVSLVVMQYWKNTQSSRAAKSSLSADR